MHHSSIPSSTSFQHTGLRTLAILAIALGALGCGSATTKEPDAGNAGTSAGEGGEGGTSGAGATSGSGGSAGAAGSSGAGATGGDGGTSGEGATGGSGGSNGEGATGGSGGSGGSAGTGGVGGDAGSAGAGGTGGDGGSAGSGGTGGCIGAGQCNDSIDCTADDCVEGACVHAIDLTLCSASQVCDLRQGGCIASTACGGAPDCADADPCTRNERCDGSVAACRWDVLDNDDDGHAPETCGGDDFDDANPWRYAGASEMACDGLDNDGDNAVDEDCSPGVCSVEDREILLTTNLAFYILMATDAPPALSSVSSYCRACVDGFRACLATHGLTEGCNPSGADCEGRTAACAGQLIDVCN